MLHKVFGTRGPRMSWKLLALQLINAPESLKKEKRTSKNTIFLNPQGILGKTKV